MSAERVAASLESRILDIARGACSSVPWDRVLDHGDAEFVYLYDSAGDYEIELDPTALDEVIAREITQQVEEIDNMGYEDEEDDDSWRPDPPTIQEERFDRYLDSLDGRDR